MLRHWSRRHLVSLAFLLTSCAGGSLLDPYGARRLELELAHSRWVAAAIRNYQFVVRNDCFCALGGVDVRVVVQNGAVTSRTVVSTNAPVPDESAGAFRDIEGLFSVVGDALGHNVARFVAAYDQTYGFPVSVQIDYSTRIADEEFGFTILSFTAGS